MTPVAPTGGQAAPALPGAQALGVFFTAGPMDGQPSASADTALVQGPVPDAADVRVVSPAPDPVPTVALGIDRNVSDGVARMSTFGIHSMEFPAVPWRAADGGGVGVHACSVAHDSAAEQAVDVGGCSVRYPADRGVSQ